MDKGDFLKPQHSILEPDPLSVIFSRIDLSSGEVHPKSLQDHYSDISTLKPPSHVPEHIRRHFDAARNALLYSWFAWDLHPIAELYAYASLEFALRDRALEAHAIKAGSQMGFKALLKLAIERGWLRVELLTEYKTLDQNQKAALKRWTHAYQESDLALKWAPQVDPLKYAAMISEVMPFARNTLAHGADDPYSNPLPILARCRELIIQLYIPTSERGENPPDA